MAGTPDWVTLPSELCVPFSPSFSFPSPTIKDLLHVQPASAPRFINSAFPISTPVA
jgi:hypothetical protein